jgi:hypothetical protein
VERRSPKGNRLPQAATTEGSGNLEFKTVSLRTGTAYEADGPGKVAQRTKAQGSGPEVNVEVAQLQFAFLSGEIPRRKCLGM